MSKAKKLSVLVDSQLPDFIASEYDNFSKFLQKYYEQLETAGQPLDIINNITTYRDIDFYEKSLLQENTTLTSSVNPTATTINVASTAGFPEKNGYFSIDEEIIFYKTTTSTSFVDCYRNVSGTTKLGDLYHINDFKSVDPEDVGIGVSHTAGTIVNNISNLFLYAFVKNFEREYLDAFPEQSLKTEVDKRILIKNIKQFYRTKGTEQSIKFIFNSIVATEPSDIPSVYYPKDNTFKASNGEWVDKYGLQVKVLSGDVNQLVGQKIVQNTSVYSDAQYSFAIVDAVVPIGDKDGETLYELVLAEDTIVGNFVLSAKTYLTKVLSSTATAGNFVNVYSTAGWNTTEGELRIGNEIITYKTKNVNQFKITSRTGSSSYAVGTSVYSNSSLSGYYTDVNGTIQEVQLLPLGYLYDLKVSSGAPYSTEGDKIQVEDSGFSSLDPIIYNSSTNFTRWFINESNTAPLVSSQPAVQSLLSEVIADVSAIYEDDQYFYIASSGFPSYSIGPFTALTNPQNQNLLKLIKKKPTTSTEIFTTTTKDVGILVNGVRLYSYKDDEEVINGSVVEIEVINQGTSYAAPPFVLFSNGNAVGSAILSGEVVEKINIVNGGTGYTSDPTVTITSGRNAIVTATVTGDRVTRLNIVNPGEYYSSPPTVVIRDSLGRGRYAEYTATVSAEGQITGFNKINEGKFYTQENVIVEIIPVGKNATAVAKVKRWRKNRFAKLQSSLDSSYGYYFDNINPALGYGYGHLANPKKLRVALNDNLDNNGLVPTTLSHSPILGFAYDGNPIYGPYGYSDPLSKQSSIERMTSSYVLNTTRQNGPSDALGTYVEDYTYVHRSGSLDENNGRFCVTPEYPFGVYAYFITIDSSNNPVFPYCLGKNYYSLPVSSNYENFISQDDLPKNVIRYRTDKIRNNGIDTFALIDSVNSGFVDSIDVVSSSSNFSVGSKVYFNEENTGGENLTASVSSLYGKPVSSIRSKQTKILKIKTVSNCYIYNGDVVSQLTSGATGIMVGDCFDNTEIVVRVTGGTFNKTGKLYTNRSIKRLTLDKESSYGENNIISLTNGEQAVIANISSNTLNVSYNPFSNNDPIIFTTSSNEISASVIYYVKNATSTSFQIATSTTGSPISITNINTPGIVAISEKGRAKVISSTNRQNSVTVEVIRGIMEPTSGYYLNSADIEDTVGSAIVGKSELSENISVETLNDNVALVNTTTNHGLSKNDEVNIDIIPNPSSTTTEYRVRRRIHQKVNIGRPVFESSIIDTGIGKGRILNSGADYASTTSGTNTFTNVELIFFDQSKTRDLSGDVVGSSSPRSVIGAPGNTNNAKATIIVSGGKVASVTITTKGTGYRKGDLLTVSNTLLNRLLSSTSTQVLKYEVLHSGFAVGETTLFLESVNNLSVDDYLTIEDEIVKITSVNTTANTVVVQRGQNNTTQADHYNGTSVTLYNSTFRFGSSYRIGSNPEDPVVFTYDANTGELEVIYNTTQTLNTINQLINTASFFDESSPAKIVTVKNIVYDSKYKFEFAKSPGNVWVTNPIINVQKYYQYKFNTSSTTLLGSFLEFSPTKNKNILTVESSRSAALPGTPGSYISVTFGFGAFYYDDDLIVDGELAIDGDFIVGPGLVVAKQPSNYVYYYYYDKNGNIDSDDSYLKVVDDPLQGIKKVVYTTPSSFVYEMLERPEYDGSGFMEYTTTSKTAIGSVYGVNIQNPGKNYKSVPTISSASVSASLESTVDAVWNSSTKTIDSVTFVSRGLNYSKPKVIIVDGDGIDADFEVTKNPDNSIKAIVVKNKGKGYTYKPSLKIVETDIVAYCNSTTIGVPKTVKIVSNGFAFNRDSTTKRKYTSSYFLSLSSFGSSVFLEGEEIIQYNGNNVIAKAKVSKNGWKSSSNILKVENVIGKFLPGSNIVSKTTNITAKVEKIFTTIFDTDIRSYYDNLGYYASDRSKLGSVTQKLADSYFYQDYSYVVKSKTPVDIWRNLIRQTIHPAGFKVFGELTVDSFANAKSPVVQPNSSNVSIINLWDPVKNKVTVENTYRTLTQSTINVSNVNQVRGKGSVLASAYDTGETSSYEFYLDPKFNGYFDESGNRAGTKTFAMKLKGSGNALTLDNINNFIVTLDGIVQEPGKSYYLGSTVGINASSGSQITFSEAPLGYRNIFGDAISESVYVDGSDSPPQRFIGRAIKFKDTSLNTQYFRKIKNISSQFNGSAKSFQLYYDDNTAVDLAAGDNLLVCIDGVVQQAGSTPLLPVDRAYYIKRTVVPNEIVFVEAPRKFDNNIQTFFAYSISSYERLTIESKYVNGTTTGPFLLRSAVSEKTVTVDDDRNVLVFLDGVLQERLRAYNINGANITFKEPIRVGQKVNILYVYGRDYKKTIKAFNFDTVPFFNRFTITLSGRQVIGDGAAPNDGIVVETLSGAVGRVKNIYFDGTNTKILVDSRNKVFTTTEDIIFRNVNPPTAVSPDFILASSNIVSIETFEENDERQDYLRRSKPGWLVASRESTSGLNSYKNFVEIGDLIKIDGESSTRRVLDIPDIVIKTNYRDRDDLNSSYYGNIAVTNYSGISLGEGLDVVANISGGKVVSLTWNKKDYPFYETKGLRPIPNAYGYESAPQLMFVAQPLKNEGGEITAEAQGGGARAYAIVENGEVIDLVLLDGGSGYLTPPKVFITRGYEIIKQSKQIDTVRVLTSLAPEILSGNTLYVTSGDSLSTPGGPPIQSITSIVTVTPYDASRDLTAIIQREASVPIPQRKADTLIVCEVQSVGAQITSLSVLSAVFYTTFESPATDIIITSQRRNTVQSVSPEILSGARTFLKIKTAPVYPTLYDTGAYLDIPMSVTDTIAYIPDTSKFTSNGKLMIEDEIVYYASKLNDRFYGIIRERDGTTAKAHPAGAFLRQYREDVTIVSAGVVDGGVPTLVETTINVSSQLSITANIVSESQLTVFNTVTTTDRESVIILQTQTTVPTITILTSQAEAVTESKVTTVSYSIASCAVDITSQHQILTPIVDVDIIPEITKFYPAGFTDFYIEKVLFTDPIPTRSGSPVTLDVPKNRVYQRSGYVVSIFNLESNPDDIAYSYNKLTLGPRMSTFNGWYTLDDGTADVSSMTLADFEINYGSFTIQDFSLESQYSETGAIWNLTYPSIQNPVAISQSTGSIGSTLNVTKTTYFPSSGYLFHRSGGVIQYTGKTLTSFTGCTVYSGSTTISAGDEIVPYSV